MFISGGKEGGESGRNVGGKKEEMTAERMLEGKIAQEITEVQEQVCPFLRHRKDGLFS